MVKLCCKMKKLQVLHMVKPKKGKGVQERIEDLRNILMHNDIHIHVCLSVHGVHLHMDRIAGDIAVLLALL